MSTSGHETSAPPSPVDLLSEVLSTTRRAERAGFPGAVGTEEAEDLSLVDRERHALDSGR